MQLLWLTRWFFFSFCDDGVGDSAKGGDLLEYILARGRLPSDVARPLFLQIVDALTYLHDNNVVHRDLKPENLLLDTPKHENVKITDFGLSKALPDGKFTGTLCGTPAYIGLHPHHLLHNQLKTQRALTAGFFKTKQTNNRFVCQPRRFLTWKTGRTQRRSTSGVWAASSFACLLPPPPPFPTLAHTCDVKHTHTHIHRLTGCSLYGECQEGSLLERVKTPPPKLQPGLWAGLSAAARDLILRLLVVKPALRLSVHSISRHPWCCGHEDLPVPLPPHVPAAPLPCSDASAATQPALPPARSTTQRHCGTTWQSVHDVSAAHLRASTLPAAVAIGLCCASARSA